ncbi:MAG: PKD domain-containing protein [Chitinophagaceae bacterium]
MTKRFLPSEAPATYRPVINYRSRYAWLCRSCALFLFILFSFVANAQVPSAAFSANKTSGCAPLVVVFQDQSTGDPKFWNWDLGNGQLSNLQNPTAVYSTPGTYTITLVVRNSNGTNGITKTNYITVFPSPQSNFGADKTTACVPAQIQFTDLSTDTVGTVSQWQWDFGDGTTSNLKNPVKLYTNTGFYTIVLTVTSSTGCTSTNGKYRYVRVVSGVSAEFSPTIDSVCRAPFNVNFANETSGPGILSYAWNFGNSNTSTQQDPSTTYAATGTYNVQLIATSEYGCSDTLVKPVAITGTNTNFNAPDSACLNKPVNFTNASTSTPLSSLWDFGDGTQSTQLNPSKTYTAPGVYQVKLYNTFTRCADSVTKQIIVLPLPSVDFTSTTPVACKGPFTVTFQDASPNAVAWLWNFGDGNTSTQQNPSHTYAANGQYNVSLRITTSFGCENIITKTAYVRIERPIVNIANVPNGGCIPYSFSPVANVVSLDGVAFYFWDFGHNGSTSTSPTPTYVYTDSGTYTIKLRITTTGGCTDSIVVNAAIRTGPTPFVDFKSDTTTACAFGAVAFTDFSNPADRWEWDFGDGGTSTARNPVHSFTDTGTFTIKLTAYNNGCGVTVTKNQFITVRPPIANFTDSVNCLNKYNVMFTSTSIVNAVYGPITYLWEFGDPGNSTSNLPNPTFTYPALGTYSVKLTVTNGGCSHTLVREVKLAADLADFTASDLNPCKDEVITLSAIGSSPANISTYQWVVNGTVQAGIARSIQTSFPANGSYSVQLTITDFNGCTDTKTVNNYIVVTGPAANFNAADTGGCRNTNITFNDLSAPAGGITQWKWDFGDGKTQTFTSPPFTHLYTDTGLFNVMLTVTDSRGCTNDTTIASLIRITKPVAAFMAATTKFCPGGDLQFTDTSRGYITAYSWDFGDGGSSTLANPIHVYTGADSSYTVRLIVTDTTGCTDTITKVNYIDVRKPKPAFTVTDSSTICPPLETKFTLGGSDYESYYWDFGDGQTSNLQDPRHFYNTYGAFEAKLYVAGYGGCVDSAMKTINVFNPYNTPITYSPLDSCNSLMVDFSITPPANTTYKFYFGDGAVDSSQRTSFQHFYASPSFYSPYAIITDKQDCQVVVGGPDVIRIYGAEPFFAIDKKAFCDSGTVYFTNYTIGNDAIVSSVWDFGDGITATTKDAIHTFDTPNTYYVSLEVTTQRGCIKRLYDTISVHRTPQPVINAIDPVCVNSPLPFMATLVQADTATTWNWSLDDGHTSTNATPQITYTKTGVKTITLEATNKLGCKSDTTRTITVVPLPNINIVQDPTIILGTGIALPVTYSSNVITYNWTPATALSCTNCPSPYANPKFNTTYKVSVTDSNGCAASRDITVTVVCNNNNFFIPNTFSPNGDGQNDLFLVRGRGIERVHSIRIFNRWGEVVFEKRNFMANDPASGWNGTVKGKPADQDVYVYVIELICENATIIPFRGNVALIR